MDLVPCRLGQILIDEDEQRQVLFLAELDGERRLPIAIGTHEAHAIARAIGGQPFPRPLTHDLLLSALAAVGAEPVEVRIVDFRDQTFFAELVLRDGGGRETAVDCRPSDALALVARRPGIRLLVSAAVIAEQG